MGSCVSYITPETTPICSKECCICYENYTCEVTLDCNHTLHMDCLTKWWAKYPQNGMICPLCRVKSTNRCFMELTLDEKPIGYYRQDDVDSQTIILRNDNYHGKTMYVSMADKQARNMALVGVIHYMGYNIHRDREFLTCP